MSSYPGRAKAVNAERDRRVSVCVLSDDWDGPWVQVDGDAEVLHMPEAEDALVDYFRCIAGEHPDWDEYRAAMRLQDKSLIRITPDPVGPDRHRRLPRRRRRPAGRLIRLRGEPEEFLTRSPGPQDSDHRVG